MYLQVFIMKSTSLHKINKELVNSFNEEITFNLDKRQEDDNHVNRLYGLKDWHLLSSLAINRPQLTSYYIHLLDHEPFDEN